MDVPELGPNDLLVKVEYAALVRVFKSIAYYPFLLAFNEEADIHYRTRLIGNILIYFLHQTLSQVVIYPEQ